MYECLGMCVKHILLNVYHGIFKKNKNKEMNSTKISANIQTQFSCPFFPTFLFSL